MSQQAGADGPQRFWEAAKEGAALVVVCALAGAAVGALFATGGERLLFPGREDDGPDLGFWLGRLLK
jgi:hypothetical protein